MIDLTQTGVYLRCPGGNVENVSDQQSAGVKWAALNIGTDPCVSREPGVWARQRSLYDSARVPCFPWLHCRSLPDVNYLIVTAQSWNSPAIGLNIEDVVDDKLALDVLGPYVRSRWLGPVHMATLRHVQNDQGWQNMAYAVAALELNSTFDVSVAMAEAQHARDEGLTAITFMYGTKLPPETFDLSICHSLYTGDDIAPTPQAWAAWAAPSGPCSLPGGDSVHDLKAACDRTYTAHFVNGTRPLSQIRLIVLHDTEGSTAEGAARWFQNPASQGAAHFCIDANHCFRTCDPTTVAFGAPGANEDGLHFEQAGFAAWTGLEWRSLGRGTIERTAYRTALWANKLKIPIRWLTDAQVKDGKTQGFTTHRQITRCFPGGTHTDPGPNYPRDLFMRRCRYWAAHL